MHKITGSIRIGPVCKKRFKVNGVTDMYLSFLYLLFFAQTTCLDKQSSTFRVIKQAFGKKQEKPQIYWANLAVLLNQ